MSVELLQYVSVFSIFLIPMSRVGFQPLQGALKKRYSF